MKKILSFLIGITVLINFASVAHAAAPTIVFAIDCNTQEKIVNMGFQSNPDDPANGPEIIALKLLISISGEGETTFDDIKGALIDKTNTDFFFAENNKSEVGSTVEIKISGGFTGGNGLSQTSDLFQIKGINQKKFKITVKEGELYPKNSTSNIYQSTNESFIADPGSCIVPPAITPDVTPVATETTQDTTAAIDITLSSSKASAKTGDSVEVTAIIKNRSGNTINWSQTSGTQITPIINDEELPDNETKSVLSFTMVESQQDIVLKLAVGDVSKEIEIKSEIESTTTTSVESTTTSIQDKLQQRRDSQNSQVQPTSQPGNIHGAAGSLSESGPGETMAIILVSALLAILWKWRRPSDVHVDV